MAAPHPIAALDGLGWIDFLHIPVTPGLLLGSPGQDGRPSRGEYGWRIG